MEPSHFAEMSSRGRQSKEMIQANCILIYRFLTAGGYSIELLEGQIAKHLGPYLGGKGPPAKRTVQEWVKETPNFPEMALKDGILTEENILPNFKPLLRLDIFHAGLQQEIPSAAQEDSSLGAKQKIAVGVAAVILIKHLFKKRPPGQGFRLTGRR